MDAIIDEFRCFVCSQYLICSPVRETADGNIICGNCPSNVSTWRSLFVEKLLRHFLFPCINDIHGCPSKLLFDTVKDHEGNCRHQMLPCPYLKTENCKWKNNLDKVNDHVTNCHFKLIRKDCRFWFDLNCNKIEEFVTVDNDNLYFIQFYYNASEFELEYSVAQFSEVSTLQNSKIEMYNTTDEDPMITMKGSACVDYRSLKMADKPFVMHIQPFVGTVFNSEIIHCNVILELRKRGTHSNVLNNLSVEHNGNRGGHTDSVESQSRINKSVSDWGSESNLRMLKEPSANKCKWDGCEAAVEGQNKTHEKSCSWRLYQCFVANCNSFFRKTSGQKHFEKHGISFYNGASKISINFKKEEPQNICTYLHKEFIRISYRKFMHRQLCPALQLKISSTSVDKEKILIRFTHDHCENRSIPYGATWNKRLLILESQLPGCFEGDELLYLHIMLKN